MRTTFSKAMAAVKGSDEIADMADGADRTLLFGHRRRRHVCDLEAGLSNRPPRVPLQTLGAVLNLR